MMKNAYMPQDFNKLNFAGLKGGACRRRFRDGPFIRVAIQRNSL
jgi:hypothetical protein